MDSDDKKMLAAQLEEEVDVAAVAADDNEHMKILSFLLAMYARDLKPRQGGSRLARCKSKPR
jgi:hypothetical protein